MQKVSIGKCLEVEELEPGGGDGEELKRDRTQITVFHLVLYP